MSVQISGPKGYEYQYCVTVLNALLLKENNAKIYVEKSGSEDATLEILPADDIKRNIEIQVKRESGLLGLPKLIEWLCHFEAHKHNNNLLKKLIDDNNSKAIFVTRSRCSDGIAFLKRDYQEINENATFSISNDFSQEFLSTLKLITLGTSSLQKRREAFCQDLALQLNRQKINNLLERCVIVEELTDEKVDETILQLLNKKFQIAQSNAKEVYLKLLEIVKLGRDEGFDINERLKKIIQLEKIGRPNIDHSYKTRSEEQGLISKLKEESLLLLTGRSQCGKTQLAKKISENFVLKGYDFCIENNIIEVKKFLRTNIHDNKVVILSDPFGHSELVERHVELSRSIQEMIAEKQSHHLLIITNRSEILLEAFNTDNLGGCSINQKNWCDLTLTDTHVVLSFWEAISKMKSIPLNIVNTVKIGISESGKQDQLQIGQLKYLANEDIQKLENKNFIELAYIARSDSREIANQLKRANLASANLLSIISISSTPVNGINLRDLAYIMSDEKSLPSLQEESSVRIFSFNDEECHFPSYNENFRLEESIMIDLEYLEGRNFISAKDSDLQVLTTSHSTFQIAGQNLFFENGAILMGKKLESYKKCISCLSEQTAYIASRNLYFIYTNINLNFKALIIDYAFIALRSIFPSVEDNALLFLTKIVEHLSLEQQQKLFEKIEKGETHDHEIKWHQEIPYKGDNNSFFKKYYFKLPDEEIPLISEKLLNNELPTSYQIWGYVKTVEGADIDKNSFKILLQAREAFIRSAIMSKVFKSPENFDQDFIKFLFEEEHPTVIFSLMSSIIKNWFNLSGQLKDLCEQLIKKSLNKIDVAIRAFSVLATFSIDYVDDSLVQWRDLNDEQKQEIWNFWGRIYPHVVGNIPLKIYLNGARFISTISTAINYLEINTGMQVFNAWYKRLEYQISRNQIIEEYEMSIMNDLLQFTGNNYEIRKDLFATLINYNDTNFLLSNLKWALDGWKHLHNSEKQQISNLLETNRNDLRWIHAVTLTSETPPIELVDKILGEENFFSKATNDFINYTPQSLFCDCLNVFCGFPQPLWWLAVHHKNRDFWYNVMSTILLNENSFGFNICLEDFIRNGVNGFVAQWEDWENLWETVCGKSSNLEYLFDRLLYNTASSTCNLTCAKKFWTELIKTYDKNEKSEIINDLILKNLEIIQRTGHGNEDLVRIFDDNFLVERIIPKISPDNALFQIINLIQSDQNNEIALELFYKTVKEYDTRFLGTLYYAENHLNLQKEANQKIIEILKIMNEKIYELGKSKLKLMNIFDYKLDDWIGVN